MELIKMDSEKRTPATMASNFTSRPDDIYTIEEGAGLSSSAQIRITNARTHEDFRLAMVNCPETWAQLKRIDKIPRKRGERGSGEVPEK